MRRIEASLLIKKRIREVWRQTSSLQNWQDFSEQFAGGGFRFRFSVVEGPRDPMAEGTRIAVTDPNGHPLMKCKLSQWDPPRRFEMTASHHGFLTGYRLLISFSLSELDDELTRAELALVAMFANRAVELLSLLLPVGFLYRRRLERVLLRLRAMALA